MGKVRVKGREFPYVAQTTAWLLPSLLEIRKGKEGQVTSPSTTKADPSSPKGNSKDNGLGMGTEGRIR